MNDNCELFRDLYDLYKDGICSEDSKKFVEAHLNECEECRKLIEAKKDNIPVVSKEKKVLKKAKRRISSKVAAIICFFLAVMLLSMAYYIFFFPEVLVPDCITSEAEITVDLLAEDYDEKTTKEITREFKKYMSTYTWYKGSVLKTVKIFKPDIKVWDYQFDTVLYKDVVFYDYVLIDCELEYYNEKGYRAFRTTGEIETELIFAAMKTDNEWIITEFSW